MQHVIKRYQVEHPLLKNFVKFFWELDIAHVELNHKIIPQRNINLRFNLNDTPQYAVINGKESLLDEVNFSGLQDKFMNTHLKLKGNVHVLGICFYPEGFYPFFNIPVHEFKNQLLGAKEIGLKFATELSVKLKGEDNIAQRLNILENELIKLYIKNSVPDNFRKIFHILQENENPAQITEFCNRNNISTRRLERMFNKYVGISANSYCTLNRFHVSLNQLLKNDFNKLSDLAFDNGYFDQMHFIKDFKRFSGNTPKSFIQQKDSILQIGKLS